MKALCLSGGASKGAYAGGMLQYMKLEMKKEYELYLGTSTGALLQTLVSINDFDALKEGYTTMGLDDIYEVSPFKKVKKSKDVGRADINMWSAAKMHFIHKEPTFGDSSKIVELIEGFFPYEKYVQAVKSGVDLVNTVTNISKVRTEYYSAQNLGTTKKAYKDFVDWVWISTCALPFASLNRRVVSNDNGFIFHKGPHPTIYSDYYADGGFMEHMPISKAIEMGATEIDAISTATEKFSGDLEPEFGNNPLKLLGRMFEITMREAMERDIDNAKKMAKDNNVTLNIYYLPRVLTENAMYFDKEQMSGWWDEGYEYMKKNHVEKTKYCKVIKMKAKKAKK